MASSLSQPSLGTSPQLSYVQISNNANRPCTGTGGVMFNTVTPYTLRRLPRAAEGVRRRRQRHPAPPPVKPFEMCYQVSALQTTRLGFAVAYIDLLLDNGRTWLVPAAARSCR